MTIMELPEDITTDILSRLPADSVLICKGVCRLWGAIVKDPRFRDKWMHRFDPAAYNDNLVTIACVRSESSRGSELQYGTFSDKVRRFDMRNTPSDYYPPCRFKGSYNWIVVGSCNGLICLATGGKRFGTGQEEIGFNCQRCSMYVGNPLMREYVKLPQIKPKTKCHCNSIGFGYCPTTKEYKVVVIYDWHVEVYIVGSGRWRTMRSSFSWSSQDSSKPGVFANGALYFHRSCGDNIVSFDLASEEFKKFPSPKAFQRNQLLQEIKLGVLGGSLCFLEWNEPLSHWSEGIIDVCDVWVMDNENSWTKKFSIQNKWGKKETIVTYGDNNHEDIIGKLRRFVWRSPYMLCYVMSIVSVKALGEKQVISMW